MALVGSAVNMDRIRLGVLLLVSLNGYAMCMQASNLRYRRAKMQGLVLELADKHSIKIVYRGLNSPNWFEMECKKADFETCMQLLDIAKKTLGGYDEKL